MTQNNQEDLQNTDFWVQLNFFDEGDLNWGQRIYIFNKFQGVVDAADPGTSFENNSTRKKYI